MLDQIIVAGSILAVLVVGLRKSRHATSIGEYSIAQRNFSTAVLSVAIFASLVGAGKTVGVAESAFKGGIIAIVSFLGIVVSNILVALFVAPKMGKFLGMISSGDIFENCYGRHARVLMGGLSVTGSVMAASGQVIAMGMLGDYCFDIPVVYGCYLSSGLIVLYCLKGGIHSVTSTDVLQFGVLIISLPLLCGLGLIELGSIDELVSRLPLSHLQISFASNQELFKYGAIFITFAIPCIFPMSMQRMLMAKNTAQIRSAFLANAALSFPFYIVMGLIGLIALALLPTTSPATSLLALSQAILPTGIKGFVIAGLFAVFMSTIDSNLNTGAVSFAHDIAKPLSGNKVSEKSEVLIAKYMVVAQALGAVVLALLFDNILYVVFLLMCLRDSIVFPATLFAVLGLRIKKGWFWAACGIGGGTACLCLFAGVFALYGMIFGITANFAVLLLGWERRPKTSIVDEAACGGGLVPQSSLEAGAECV